MWCLQSYNKSRGKSKGTFYENSKKRKNRNLHFDGKHIKKTEYQVVILKNENREVKEAVLGQKKLGMEKMNENSME